MVNVRVYPTMDVYQNKVVELTPSMMGDVNQELRDSLSNGVMLGGGQVTHRYGTEKIKINRKVYLLSKYRRRSSINPNFHLRVSL